MNVITAKEVRDYFATVDEEAIQEFLDCGLNALIEELEEDDFFGTEGFEKRFS